MSEQRPTHKHSDEDGHFRRKPSQFRNSISKDPNSDFPAETGRYALYMNYGCPWAHRTVLVRSLKGLEDIIQMIPTDCDLTKNGWIFTGKNGSVEKDPLYGFTELRQLYWKADPNYEGRYLVPTLWDKKKETIVSNESSEIIRMFYTEFDDLISEELREANRPGGGFLPIHLKDEIDAMNDWVYNTVNNGVYKCGFATSQTAYDANIYPLFDSLDRLEAHLAPGNPANRGGPYLFGLHITEADIRLYTTLIRFDAAYHTIFQCNRKLIRHDYPNLYTWLRLCYWRGGAPFITTDHDRTYTFKDTSDLTRYRFNYARAKQRMYHKGDDSIEVVVPAGPAIDIDPLDNQDVLHAADASAIAADNIEKLRLGSGQRDAVAAVFAANEGSSNTGAAGQNGIDGLQVIGQPNESLEPHERENEKWYRAVEKAREQDKFSDVHLAL